MKSLFFSFFIALYTYSQGQITETKNFDLICKVKVITETKNKSQFQYFVQTDTCWKGSSQSNSKQVFFSEKNLKLQKDSVYIFYVKNFYIYRAYAFSKTKEEILNFYFRFYLNDTSSFFKTNNHLLTKEEFNFIKKVSLDSIKINLSGKKVIFTTDLKVIGKKDWYDNYKFWFSGVPFQIIELNDAEKKKYNLDYIIVSFCKFKITDKMKNKILRHLK